MSDSRDPQSFIRDREGRVVIAQAPNPAICVFIVATVLRWSPWDEYDTELRWIGTGALLVWAVDELVRGEAPVRRVLGAIVLAWQAGRFVLHLS